MGIRYRADMETIAATFLVLVAAVWLLIPQIAFWWIARFVFGNLHNMAHALLILEVFIEAQRPVLPADSIKLVLPHFSV